MDKYSQVRINNKFLNKQKIPLSPQKFTLHPLSDSQVFILGLLPKKQSCCVLFQHGCPKNSKTDFFLLIKLFLSTAQLILLTPNYKHNFYLVTKIQCFLFFKSLLYELPSFHFPCFPAPHPFHLSPRSFFQEPPLLVFLSIFSVCRDQVDLSKTLALI